MKTEAIRRSQIFFRSCLAQQKLMSQRISFCQLFVVLHYVIQLHQKKNNNVQLNKQTHIKTRIMPFEEAIVNTVAHEKSNGLLSKEPWG